MPDLSTAMSRRTPVATSVSRNWSEPLHVASTRWTSSFGQTRRMTSAESMGVSEKKTLLTRFGGGTKRASCLAEKASARSARPQVWQAPERKA